MTLTVANESVVVAETLEALAAQANAEHAEVLGSIRSALDHAIKCGDALLAAQEQVDGSWLEWLARHFNGGQATGQQYMRLAFYKSHILDAPEPLPLKRAYLYLRGLPAIDGKARRGRRPAPRVEDIEEAKRLRAKGMTYGQIGEVFGLSDSTIRHRLDPNARKRETANRRRAFKRRKEARLALEQKERAKATKKAGGSIAEAYSLMRKTAQTLERALDAASADERSAIRESLAALHKAEDELVRALGIAHGGHARARTFTASERAA